MEMLGFSTAALFLLIVCGADKATYDKYQVHRVMPSNVKQVKALVKLENLGHFDFWLSPGRPQKPVDIMVPPHQLPQFQDMMRSLNLTSSLFIKDVNEVIEIESQGKTAATGFDWGDYYDLDRIYDWLDTLVKSFPSTVTSVIGGKTYEDRRIKGVKVSYKRGNPGVFIEGGIHAREWISPATVTYILNKLLINKDPEIRDLAESFDFYVFPNFNPDGYVYSRTKQRMWRKSRRPLRFGCYGVDLNRNWNFHWKEKGTFGDACSETYAGSQPFSEIETRSMANYISTIKNNLSAYFSFHSYSQLLLFPFGHTKDHISNYDELMTIGKMAADALSRNNGTKYTVGSIFNTIYPASGGSTDWVRGKFDIPYTYTWELRDLGKRGFLLPPDQIIDRDG